MLTRLHVKGFRNLQDVEIRFGPLTCFVGANGSGKTNLMDAVRFLNLLSRYPIEEAARRLTSLDACQGNIENLFTKFHDYMAPEIHLEADMILNREVEDDLGMQVEASTSSVRYSVTLKLFWEKMKPSLHLFHESLEPITLKETRREIGFSCSRTFKDSVITGRRAGPFISTGGEPDNPEIRVHQEGHSSKVIPAMRSHWTVLGGSAVGDFPTILATVREIRSWRFFHLEPSALARPSHREDMQELDATGGRLSSALERIRSSAFGGMSAEKRAEGGYQALKNLSARLSGFIGRNVQLRLQLDQESDTVRPAVEGDDATPHPLSGGMLRYLALATLLENPEGNSLLAIEEPENGIHPSGLAELARLLEDLAVDPHIPVGLKNPLRQVLLTTHSPIVLQCLRSDELVYLERIHHKGTYFQGEVAEVRVSEDGWRNKAQKGSKPLRDEHVRPYYHVPGKRAEQTAFDFKSGHEREGDNEQDEQNEQNAQNVQNVQEGSGKREGDDNQEGDQIPEES